MINACKSDKWFDDVFLDFAKFSTRKIFITKDDKLFEISHPAGKSPKLKRIKP